MATAKSIGDIDLNRAMQAHYMQTVQGSFQPQKERDFEFCKSDKVDWAKFAMWLRGFLAAIEGQNLTPESIAKIMEKLAYVDPDAKPSYTKAEHDALTDMLRSQWELERYMRTKNQAERDLGDALNRPISVHPFWVSNPSYQGNPAGSAAQQWRAGEHPTALGLNDFSVQCANQVDALPNTTRKNKLSTITTDNIT